MGNYTTYIGHIVNIDRSLLTDLLQFVAIFQNETMYEIIEWCIFTLQTALFRQFSSRSLMNNSFDFVDLSDTKISRY